MREDSGEDSEGGLSAYDRTFEQLIIEKLKTERDRHADDVVRGIPPELYSREVGFIAALDEISAWIEQTKKTLRDM